MGEAETKPRCPFCGAPWTDYMLSLFDAALSGGCSCGHAHRADGTPDVPAHSHDAVGREIVCAACGRAIYRALSPDELS